MSSMLYIASQNQTELDNRTEMTLSCPRGDLSTEEETR